MESNDKTGTSRRGSQQNETGKQLVVRVLSDLLGRLEDIQCAADDETEIRPSTLPECIGLDNYYRDEAFPDKAHSAAIELLDFLEKAPEDLDAFNRIASHGKLTREVEQEFTALLWILLMGYALQFGQFVEERGRDPERFLNIAPDVVKCAIEQINFDRTYRTPPQA